MIAGRRLRARLAVAAIATACAACSLVVDLSTLGSDAGVGPDAAETGAPDVIVPEASSDASAYSFSDDFNRADGSIGNGWVVKNPSFDLASGHMVRDKVSSLDFLDLLVHRPTTEAVLDIHASMVVVLSGADGGGGSWEQIHVRIQPSTVDAIGRLDDYMMFPHGGGANSIDIGRNRITSSAYAIVTTFTLSSPMVAGAVYRFTLSATGASPVVLFGSVERLDGPSTWTLIGSAQTQDLDPSAVTTPGVVGFSASNADLTGAYTYDDYVATGN